MIVTTKQLFAHAYGKYAIGAYNINNLEQTMGLFEGNVRSRAPFIVQLSKGARSYTHKKMLEAMMKTAEEIFPDAISEVNIVSLIFTILIYIAKRTLIRKNTNVDGSAFFDFVYRSVHNLFCGCVILCLSGGLFCSASGKGTYGKC